MSQKWRRSLAWDDATFPRWAWPAKFMLRAFSSISLAVVLLTLVCLYGVLASMPIGLVALAPTVAVYALTVLGVIAVVAALPTCLFWTWAPRIGVPVLARWVGSALLFITLTLLGVWLWKDQVWPRLHYDPATGSGLRFFADFVDRYQSTTLRRLPGMEMSELEFYSWWPLRLILLLFVANMVVATVRRIEFKFVNIGVLTVHTGIVVIALGSVYYSGLKLEGDTLLLAGRVDPKTGTPEVGPAQDAFYSNTMVALYVTQAGRGEQRRILGLPRYNDYNLTAGAEHASLTLFGGARRESPPRDLAIDVPGALDVIDRDISVRIVGYAHNATLIEDAAEAPAPADPALARPARLLRTRGPSGPGERAIVLRPKDPASRVAGSERAFLEYTLGPDAGMTQARWDDLAVELPPGTMHALLVDVPAYGHRGVYPVEPGSRVAVGDTGYLLEVKDLLPAPPMPIITPGYQGATSSLAVVTVRNKALGASGGAYDRWVYHRFPEISQDMLSEVNPQTGMPRRRPAADDIRVRYIDASAEVSIYVDEPSGPASARAIVRRRGGEVVVMPELAKPPGAIALVPGVLEGLDVELIARWDHAADVERPLATDDAQSDSSAIGTHESAAVAVELSAPAVRRLDGTTGPWTRTLWVPFAKYLEAEADKRREVILPDGREIGLMFGRWKHRLPNFTVALVDFEMIAYDHRGAPRDYQTVLRVSPVGDAFTEYTHKASLNYPLMAPFMWSESRGPLANLLGRLASGLSPHQFKFSQAGWDATGWRQTQAMADQGMIQRPFVQFTILQVGNNPGIHVIALGAVLMGLGIPWAFYVKPWLVRREKARIQRELAAGGMVKPSKPGAVSALEPVS